MLAVRNNSNTGKFHSVLKSWIIHVYYLYNPSIMLTSESTEQFVKLLPERNWITPITTSDDDMQ